MQNRIKLIEHFRDLAFKKGAEIGVFDGRFSEVICQIIPGVDLLCVDNWKDKWLRSKPAAIDRLSKYNAIIIHDTSLNTAKVINDRSLDFVFIDGEHSYPSVKEDIEAWAPKVKIGGIVSGHDYYITRTKNKGVIDAVDGYVSKHNYKLLLTDEDKENPVEDDRQPSWYFIKDK